MYLRIDGKTHTIDHELIKPYVERYYKQAMQYYHKNKRLINLCIKGLAFVNVRINVDSFIRKIEGFFPRDVFIPIQGDDDIERAIYVCAILLLHIFTIMDVTLQTTRVDNEESIVTNISINAREPDTYQTW